MQGYTLRSAHLKGYTPLILLVLSLFILTTFCGSLNADDNVQVDIDILPELLTDSTFPESQGKPGRDFCTSYLGCVKIQNGRQPKDAVTMDTEFFVYSRNVTRLSIPYKENTTNCLKESQGDICRDYPFDLSNLLVSGIDFSKKIVIITSGFYSKVQTDWQIEMSKVWLDVEDVVVIIVAWPGGNSRGKIMISYEDAVANTRVVARQISSLLYYIGKLNGNITITQNPNVTRNIHLIGHSLGAHISGFVGKDFEGSIGRIVGLDPAGPDFNTKERVMKLDRRDAQLVECFHSNAGRGKNGKFGHEKPLCHLDYYVNGGVTQPGCGIFQIACSHKMINDLFTNLMKAQAESATISAENGPKSFEMLSAFVGESYDSFRLGKSFNEYCPKFAIPDSVRDFVEGNDFDQCSIPLDLLSPFDKYKQLLQQDYGHLINLDGDQDPVNQTYFQSFGRERSEAVLLRAKYPNLNNNTRNKENYESTNFMITIQPLYYSDKNYSTSYKSYDMLPNVSNNSASFNILTPLQIHAPTEVLAKFVNSQFYLDQADDDYKALRSTVASVFPVKLQLRNTAKPKFSNFIHLTRRVTLTLLKKTNRSILISYNFKRRENDLAEVHILKSDTDDFPYMDFLSQDDEAREMTLYIDKIIIGPPRIAQKP